MTALGSHEIRARMRTSAARNMIARFGSICCLFQMTRSDPLLRQVCRRCDQPNNNPDKIRRRLVRRPDGLTLKTADVRYQHHHDNNEQRPRRKTCYPQAKRDLWSHQFDVGEEIPGAVTGDALIRLRARRAEATKFYVNRRSASNIPALPTNDQFLQADNHAFAPTINNGRLGLQQSRSVVGVYVL